MYVGRGGGGGLVQKRTGAYGQKGAGLMEHDTYAAWLSFLFFFTLKLQTPQVKI